MLNVCIIGAGNVAWHMEYLMAGRHNIVQFVHRREITNMALFAPHVDYNEISTNCDVYIISVSDDALQAVAEKISPFIPSKALVVHTSGTKSVHVLDAINAVKGVLWPIQSLSKGRRIDRKDIPIGITASDETHMAACINFAKSICPTVIQIANEEKPKYHLMAVWLNNFINHLIAQSELYCEEHQLNGSVFDKLIKLTVLKPEFSEAIDVQTGPARRHDLTTINTHQALLADVPMMLQIYQLLSQSIMDSYPKKPQ